MDKDRDELLRRMAPIIEEQIGRRDTRHHVFRGCIDWHSAVHGHWALFRIARLVDGCDELAELANGSMERRGMANEAAMLAAQPGFEMPYGRAWFLALARDYELWSAGDQRLRAMADAVAGSLRAFYDGQAASANSHEYQNASWAFAQLYHWYAFVECAADVEWVRAQVRARFAEPPTRTFAEDHTLEQFFSPTGNWLYLIAHATPDALPAAITAARLDADALRPITELPRTAHGLGLNWSRAWCLAALGLTEAFDAHVAAAMAHHELKAADVWAYRHWVPQFAVYALTEGASRGSAPPASTS